MNCCQHCHCQPCFNILHGFYLQLTNYITIVLVMWGAAELWLIGAIANVACYDMWYEMQDAKKSPKIAIWAPSQQLCLAISLQLRHISTINNMSSRYPHNMVSFGQLAAEISPVVWGTPANFSGFRVLAALLHGSQVVGVSQTLRRWTEGTTFVRQGDRHVGHWSTHILVLQLLQYGILSAVCVTWAKYV